MISDQQRNNWKQKAVNLKIDLKFFERTHKHSGRVTQDKSAFFGYRFNAENDVHPNSTFELEENSEISFDFGKHLVGDFQFDVDFIGNNVGGPLRFKIILGEIPAELEENIEPYSGTLSKAWFQEEIVTLEFLPQTVTFSRRFAFQYVKIILLAKSFDYKVVIKNVKCVCVTSAESEIENYLMHGLDQELKEIDLVALRTLRNTMQETFIDGPKRDKRLWLGDFPLLSQTNNLTFKNPAIAKKCFYLFASQLMPDGRMPACIYTKPKIKGGTEYIVDFAILFGSYLFDYAEETRDWKTAKDLWQAAYSQAEIVINQLDEHGLFSNPDNAWVFIDWNQKIEKQAAINAVIIYSIKKLSLLAEELNFDNEKENLESIIKKMKKAAVGKFYDTKQQIFCSGKEKQISWASQIWMILAEVVDEKTTKLILSKMLKDDSFVKPVTPYLYHYTLEVLFKHGFKDEAISIIKDYWGGMVKKGASTFWEVYKHDDPKFSPYNDYLINSYCHSWSCTPAYFFRKYF